MEPISVQCLPGRLDKPRDITGKQAGRKYSVNVDFVNRKSDLIASPIKEPIKEQVSEDEEELKEGLYEPPIIKHNTFNSKSFNQFEDNGLFGLRHKENDFHLDIYDKLPEHEFPMDIDIGPAP